MVTNTYILFLRFEVLTTAVMKVAIFWYTAQCSSYMNQRYGETVVNVRTKCRYMPDDGNFSYFLLVKDMRKSKFTIEDKFLDYSTAFVICT
jgi:hypothetical protein